LVADSPAEHRVTMDYYVSALERHLRLRVPELAFSVLRTPALRHRGKLARRLRTVVDRYFRLPLAIRKSRASIVHITDQTYSHLIPWSSAPTVVTCHDLTPLKGARRSIGVQLYRASIGRLRDADRVVADSQATKSELELRLRLLPNQITVIPLGVDPIFFGSRWLGRLEPLRILHVGSNFDYKRMPLVVTTLLRLKQSGLDPILCKVGFPLEAELVDNLETAGVRFEDHGPVTTARLADLYAEASLLLFPSASEGFGWPVAEAVAVGLPVVASDLEVLRETSGGYATHVHGDSAVDYAAAIIALIQQPAQTAELRESGRRWASRYSWDAHVEELAGVYIALLEPGEHG
jgi:alpha-1,3-rhamnosyl/mannosyltransferase